MYRDPGNLTDLPRWSHFPPELRSWPGIPQENKLTNLPPFFMVFDVESIGLHGEAFAVGLVVIDSNGNEVDSRVFSCRPDNAQGDAKDREWVNENVPYIVANEAGVEGLQHGFWNVWLQWKQRGAVLVADCCWPVEANFLSACVRRHLPNSKWYGPYPLHDIASMLLMAGMDPTGSYWEESDGQRHHPLNDARQSARMLKQVLLARSVAAD